MTTARDTLVTHIHLLAIEGHSISKIILSEEFYQSLKQDARHPETFYRTGEIYMKPYKVSPMESQYELHNGNKAWTDKAAYSIPIGTKH